MPISGTKLPLRSEHYSRIETVVVDAFVHCKAYTQRALAKAVAHEFGVDEEDTAGGMVYYLRQLANRGVYEAQAGRLGSKGTKAKGSPTSPLWFNWSAVAVEDATFRHALEPFLSDPEVADWRKEAIRKAIRFYRELPTQCHDDRVLEAASNISAAKLYELPNTVYAEAAERYGRQTAKNYRGAVRFVLAYAATRRSIPMIFPYFNQPGPWAEFIDRYFPLADVGESSGYVRRHRNGMSYIRRAALALYGDDIAPEEITRERGDEIIRRLSVVEGDLEAAVKAKSTMRELAGSFHVGPLANKTEADDFAVQTRYGLRPSIYLRDPNDTADTGGWNGLLLLLERLQFPRETIDFLDWYKTYVTMPARELMKRENRHCYPERRDAHRLSPNSLHHRITALRAYLGAAVNVLKLPPEALTPDVLFGTGFDDIGHALADWWHDRREALLADGRDTAISGALGTYLIGIGMMCFTRYELLRFNRRRSVAVINKESAKNPSDRIVRIDTIAEEGAAKTPGEQAAWDAYRLAYSIANKLQAIVKGERGANRAGTPEFKNIKEMMRNTPPQWFITILEHSIERVRVGMRQNRDDFKFHKLVRDTVDLAFHISTGCRSEETCLVRMDEHLTPERVVSRVIYFRPEQRKNNKEHEVLLQPAYLPDDLLEFYLARTRSFFMREQYLQVGRARGPWKKGGAALVQDHPFFLVSTRGNAYGVERLDDEAEVLRLAQRAQDHGKNLKAFLAREAVRCGLVLPGRKYELGPHVIRGVFAYALYVMTKSAQVAAHYLGDEENTVRLNYSAISGVHVDSSVLIGFEAGPRFGAFAMGTVVADVSALPRTPRAATEQELEAEYLMKMEELRQDRRNGIIDQVGFEELRTAYRRQFQRDQTTVGATTLSAA